MDPPPPGSSHGQQQQPSASQQRPAQQPVYDTSQGGHYGMLKFLILFNSLLLCLYQASTNLFREIGASALVRNTYKCALNFTNTRVAISTRFCARSRILHGSVGKCKIDHLDT